MFKQVIAWVPHESISYSCPCLCALGFEVLPSKANFIFARSDKIGGEALYLELKRRGILVRHFTNEKIKEYNRSTIGTMEEMQILVQTIEAILKENER